MSERQDFIALDWVAGEIGETLKQASQALEAYVANRDDIPKLKFCLTHIHQVHGTLQMVEFFGAALLAEEMESLAQDLSQGVIHNSHVDDALHVLQNAIVQLPIYLKKVKQNRHGLPATLLPVLNDLRAVRGESLLSETVLFSPDIKTAVANNIDAERTVSGAELAEVAQKLRQMFQIALLGLIRGKETKKNLNYLAKVCARLVKLTNGFQQQALWRVCIAVLEGMLNNSIDASVAVKILLRQVDRQIKIFVDQGDAALEHAPPEDLLKNLLYYVARSKATSRFISEIKAEYLLDSSLLGSDELGDEALATPDGSTMHSVVEALVQELQATKTAFVDAGSNLSELADVLPLFKRVSDTMAILGLGGALKQFQEPYSRLAKILATQYEISQQDIDDITDQLSEVEKELNPAGIVAEQAESDLFNDSEEAQAHLDRAFDSVVQESRTSLDLAKEAIIEFVATQWNHECLSDLPGMLSEIRGSLKMVPLTKAADILLSCEDYVTKTLLADSTIPEWQMLDTLADAITSVDYYLERLADDNSAEGDAILEVAAESVAELGYPIAIQNNEAELAGDVESAEPAAKDSFDANDITEPPTLADVIPHPASNKESLTQNVESDISPTINDTIVDAGDDFSEQDEAEPVDAEIVEIFIEEAGEVIETVKEYLPKWQGSVDDGELGAEVRRAFHTLKGSGRMVGAEDIGEFAWSIENMLNRVQDGSMQMDANRFELVNEAIEIVPSLISAFESREVIDKAPQLAIIARADSLSKEQNPAIEDDRSEHADDLDVIPTITDVQSNDESNNESNDGDGGLGEELDSELLEIFASETANHGYVLDSYIAHCRELAGPADLTDELQRALHTLKGSANMAGITPVATIVTPLEYVVKELRASQLKVDEPLVALLERGSLFIKAGIEQLAISPLEVLPGTEDYVDELLALFNDRIAHINDEVEDGGIAPETLNLFLTESLDLITEMSGKLVLWQQEGNGSEDAKHLEQLMSRFVEKANTVNMLAAVELGEAIEVLYRRASEYNQKTDDGFFVLANKANDGIIDILDQIAGHQNPVMDAGLFNAIQDYEFEASEVAEQLSVQSAEAESGDAESNELIQALLDGDGVSVVASGGDTTQGVPDIDMDEIDGEFFEVEDLDFAEAGIQLKDTNASEDSFTADEFEVSAEDLDDVGESLEIDAAQIESVAEIKSETAQQFGAPANAFFDDDDDESIDAEIVEIFLEEADDLLENLDESIHGWSDDRGNTEYLDDILRVLHTLKGGARLAGLVAVGNLSHNFETSLMKLEGLTSDVDDETLAEAQSFQDQLIAQIAAVKAGEEIADVDETQPDDIVANTNVVSDLEQPLGNDSDAETSIHSAEVTEIEKAASEDIKAGNNTEPFLSDMDVVDSADEDASPSFEAVDDLDESVSADDASVTSGAIVPIVGDTPREVSATEVPTPLFDPDARKAPQEVVKVSAQLLEELVNLAGETSISRGRAEEQISELVFSLDDMQITVDRLQEQVRRLDMETEQQILYRQEQVESEGLEGFDPLEMDRYSQLQQLSRSLLESSSDLVDIKSTLSDKSRDMETLLIQQSRINTDLQEGLMRSRMVPFSRMVPRLRRIVRQISSELGKNVDFHLNNVEGELDRTVLERMVSPLEHMLRNAVDHGIESEDQRLAAGKQSRGSVALELSREGGEIVLMLSDDGAGIDLNAVKNKAIERGLMEPGAELSDREIMQFILQAGFSTAAEVTQISGRGVGMDVVHSEIKQLGGSMTIDSVAGKGSRFTVRLPFTVSVNRALMVNVGGDSYAIPLNTIEGIVRVSPFELEAYYQPDAPMFEYAGQPYLLRYMGALLQRGEKPMLEGQSMPLPVVLVRGAEHSVAVQVDHLMGSREIVVKPLGPQFGQVQGLSGATVLGDGSVVVILDLLALIRADASHLHRSLSVTKDNAIDDDKNLLVMVVDDSVTVRKVTSRFLERQGMEVLLAKDGVDAVTQLMEIERIPDVMLLDIEMPRMDGFEVANRVRHNSRIKDIPIIMITSRTGEKHRERALALGVNEYLGKPYQETTLLNTIQSLIGTTQSSQ